MARPENPIEYASTDQLYRGSRIRELRQKKGLSREKMAALLGCHPDSLSNVETNSVDPSQRMLAKLAKLLEVPLEHLAHTPVHPRIQRKKASGSRLLPGVVHSALALPNSPLYIAFEQIEAIIEPKRLSKEETERMADWLVDSTKLGLRLIKP